MSDIVLQGYADLFPVGTPVKYFPIMSESKHVDCEIRSEPWRLGHGAIVVKVTGKAGGVSVDHLRKSPSLPPHEGEG